MKCSIKIYLKILLPLLFIFFFTSNVNAGVVRDYINKYHNLVEQLSAEYGIPTSVITAISIVESGAGQTKNGRLLNNHFGIVGKNNLLKTTNNPYFCVMGKKRTERIVFENVQILDAGAKGVSVAKAPDGKVTKAKKGNYYTEEVEEEDFFNLDFEYPSYIHLKNKEPIRLPLLFYF